VEIWQRIESALGKQLPEYEVAKDEVMVLAERVGEAQRQAIMEMKAYDEKKGTRGKKFGKGKRTRDDMDQEEG
jgi:ATP-dependent RNA helicase DDX47/RRP3